MTPEHDDELTAAHHTPTRRRFLVGGAGGLAALLVAGCASADKTTSDADTTTSGSTGVNMSGMSGMSGSIDTKVPEVNGIKPVPITQLASGTWQGMAIMAQSMTPVEFVTVSAADGGKVKETYVKPSKDDSFHLMIMLNDAHTNAAIPYASVWARIFDSAGKMVYNDQQWPMISAYMGPHYGNNVPHIPAGRYKLEVLISPPVSARHLEYAHVWLEPHTVVEHFTWTPTA